MSLIAARVNLQQGEKGDVKLTVAPLGSGSREFLVYALPQSVFEIGRAHV